MAAIPSLLTINLGLLVGVFLALWLLSLALHDASIVDPCWGLGFVLVAVYSFLVSRPSEPRSELMLYLTAIWGIRLSAYLFWRNWGHGEDYRYRAMRDKYGPKFWIVSLGTVFMLQAVLLWFVSWPVQIAILDGGQLNVLDAAGCLLWLVGIAFESIGDFQLARFKRNPQNAGRVLDTGLWRYTRHPNYFGDFCVWWGLYLIATASGAWWTILSPVVMSVLLMKVSGVALLESTIRERRPAYREYIERTNAFFPWLPRE